MSSAMGLAKLGSALRQNWLLALLVLVQSVLNIESGHGLGLTFVFAAQLGSVWLLYGKSCAYIAKVYFFTFSVIIFVLAVTNLKMDFLFRYMAIESALVLQAALLGLISAAASVPFVFWKKKQRAGMWQIPVAIFFTSIAAFTMIALLVLVYSIAVGKQL